MSRSKSIFITKAENVSKEGKRQIRDRTRESDFRRRCLKEEKLSSIKCVVMRLRNYTVRKIFHLFGDYTYLIHLLIFVAAFSGRCYSQGLNICCLVLNYTMLSAQYNLDSTGNRIRHNTQP